METYKSLNKLRRPVAFWEAYWKRLAAGRRVNWWIHRRHEIGRDVDDAACVDLLRQSRYHKLSILLPIRRTANLQDWPPEGWIHTGSTCTFQRTEDEIADRRERRTNTQFIMSTAIHTTLFVRFLYDMHHRTVHMRENTKEATGFSSDERRTQQCRTRSGSDS
jgi:hypothetical protein